MLPTDGGEESGSDEVLLVVSCCVDSGGAWLVDVMVAAWQVGWRGEVGAG